MRTRAVCLELQFLVLLLVITHLACAQKLAVEPAGIIVIHDRVYTEDAKMGNHYKIEVKIFRIWKSW